MTRRPLSDPTAVVARRGGAWFINAVLCGLAAAVPALLLADAYSLDRGTDGLELERHGGDLGIFIRDTVIVLRQSELAITVGAFALGVLIFLVVLPGRRGWTPGHLAADLRIVRHGGERVGIGRALVRTVAWVIDILPGLPLVAYSSARLTRRHQRVGDLLAKTYVVDKRAAGRPVDAAVDEDATVLEPEIEPAPSPEPQPEADPAPAPEPEPVRAATGPPDGVPTDEPIWDRRHQRYVLWHSKAGRWLTHTDSGWAPLERETPAGTGPEPSGDRQEG